MFPKAMADQYYRAQQLYDAGKPDQALPLLEEINQVAPNHPMIMQGRAMCLHALGRDEEAYVLCNKMFTMLNDRRGLEMRKRWDAEKQGKAPVDAFEDTLAGLVEEQEPQVNWTRLAVIVLLGFIAAAVGLGAIYLMNPAPPEINPLTMARPVTAAVAPAAETALNFDLPAQPRDPYPGAALAQPNEIQSWIAGLGTERPESPLFSLCEAVTVESTDAIIPTLAADPSPMVRGGVATVLGNSGDLAAIIPLTKALEKDDSAYVRLRAAWALGEIAKKQAEKASQVDTSTLDPYTPLVNAANNDASADVRAGAIRALYRAAGKESFANYSGLIKVPQDPLSFQTFAWATGTQSGQGTVPAEFSKGQFVTGYESGTFYGMYIPYDVDTASGQPVTLLALVHNASREVDSAMELLKAFAAVTNDKVLIAPYFDALDFPQYASLNIGLREPRADRRFFEIIGSIVRNNSLTVDKLYLYEDAPAAGFAMTIALAYPQLFTGVAVGNPAVLPSLAKDALFPAGLAPNPFASDLRAISAARFFETPVTIISNALASPEQLESYNAFYRKATATTEEAGKINALHVREADASESNAGPFVNTVEALFKTE